eukprot:scaffold132495_cov13-Prasinocladus_malaysianus.AAC.1
MAAQRHASCKSIQQPQRYEYEYRQQGLGLIVPVADAISCNISYIHHITTSAGQGQMSDIYRTYREIIFVPS